MVGNSNDGDENERTCRRRTLLKQAAFVGGPTAAPSLMGASDSELLDMALEGGGERSIRIRHAGVDNRDYRSYPTENIDGGKPAITTDRAQDSVAATLKSNLDIKHAGLAYTVGEPVFQGRFIPDSSGEYEITATQYASGQSMQERVGEGKIAAINVIRPKLCIREKRSQGACLNSGSTTPIKHAKIRALSPEVVIEQALTYLPRLDADLVQEIMADIGAGALSKHFEENKDVRNPVTIDEFDLTTTLSAEKGTEYVVENRVQIINVAVSLPKTWDWEEFVSKAIFGGNLGKAIDTELDRIINDFEVTYGVRGFSAEKISGDTATPRSGVGPVDDTVFEIISTEEAELYYAFVVRGDVEKAEVSDKVGASKNDARITGSDTETTIVRGFTGNPGYGDAYKIDGEILWFQQTGGTSDYRLKLGGEAISGIGNSSGGEFKSDPPRRSQYMGGNPVEGVLEIVATDKAELYYTVVVRGDVEKTEVSDKIGASKNDARITGRNEETTIVRGFTGNPGYGDAYKIDGEVLALHRSGGASDFFVRFDGERVTLDKLLHGETDRDNDQPETESGSSLLEIVSTEEGEYSYTFEVHGSVEKARVSEKIQSQDNDDIQEVDDDTVVVDGYTGNAGYGDAFRITGEITDFEHEGGDADVVIRLDGEEVSIDELQ